MRLGARNLFLAWLLILVPSPLLAGDGSADDDIRLGMSTVLSGPTADLGVNILQGVFAGLERANRAGGVHGRKLRIIALDDGYEPSRTAPNMRQLLENDNVLAIIGNVGTPTAIAAIPIATERKTVFFAPVTGAGVSRHTPPNRYVFNYRASYAAETGAMVDALIDRGGLKPEDIAIFTQRDGYGDSGYKGVIAAMKRHGLTDEKQIIHVRYERNTLAVEGALASLLYAEHQPRAVVMVGAYAPCAKFIKLAYEAKLNALFLNVSFVGSDPLAAEVGKLPVPVIVTQVVPYPLASDVPIVREYEADLKAQNPTATPGFGSLEGYIATRILVSALEKIPGQPTREDVLKALENLGHIDLDLGTTEKLDFSPTDHDASHSIWPTILRDGTFVPFDWADTQALVEGTKAQ